MPMREYTGGGSTEPARSTIPGLHVDYGRERAMTQALRPDGEDDERFPPFAFPQINSTVVERAAAIARGVWRRCRRQSIVLFLLDLATGRWQEAVPLQQCSPHDVRCQLRELGLPPLPETVRLAGALRAMPVCNPEELLAEVPRFHGLHIFFDPERDWLAVWCFLRTGKMILPVAASQVVYNDADPVLELFQSQLVLVDEL